jgi:hypothetical protein
VTRLDPCHACKRLATRTMPIRTGVVPDAPMAAPVASVDAVPEPSAAVRHVSIAVITRRWAVESEGPAAARHVAP